MLKAKSGQYVKAQVNDASGAAVTSGVTVYLAKDAGARFAGSGTTTHLGGGLWRYDLSFSDTNADSVAVQFVPGTGVASAVHEYTTVKLADAVTHGGSDAKIRLGDSSGSGSPGLYITATQQNAWGVLVVHEGTGASGATGGCVKLLADSNGYGLFVSGATYSIEATLREVATAQTVSSVTTVGTVNSVGANGITAASIAAGAITSSECPALANLDAAVSSRAATGAAMTLTSAALDAILIESGISAGASLTDDAGTQLTSINARQALAAMLSVLAGVLAGGGTTNETIKPAGKPAGNTRINATVDMNGNRSAVTIKVPT